MCLSLSRSISSRCPDTLVSFLIAVCVRASWLVLRRSAEVTCSVLRGAGVAAWRYNYTVISEVIIKYFQYSVHMQILSTENETPSEICVYYICSAELLIKNKRQVHEKFHPVR